MGSPVRVATFRLSRSGNRATRSPPSRVGRLHPQLGGNIPAGETKRPNHTITQSEAKQFTLRRAQVRVAGAGTWVSWVWVLLSPVGAQVVHREIAERFEHHVGNGPNPVVPVRSVGHNNATHARRLGGDDSIGSVFDHDTVEWVNANSRCGSQEYSRVRLAEKFTIG